MTLNEGTGQAEDHQEQEEEHEMSETTLPDGAEESATSAHTTHPEPQVIYVERPGVLTRWWRRCVGQVLGWNEAWTRGAIEAELPESWRRRVPESWDTSRGRALVGAGALVVMAVWAALVVWLMS